MWSRATRFLKHESSLEYFYNLPRDLVETDGRGEEAVINQLNGLIEWFKRGKIWFVIDWAMSISSEAIKVPVPKDPES